MRNAYLMCQTITNSAGTERALCNLANILADSECNVHILSIETTEGNAFYNLNPKIQLHHLGFNVGNKKLVSKLRAYCGFYQTLKSLNEKTSENIFIGTYTPFNCVISLLDKKACRVGCEHLNYMAASVFRRLARRFFYRRLTHTVLLTESDRKHYSFLRNTVVIPNSLSFPPQKIARYDNKNILAIGRLMYQKGFDMMIRVAELVKESAPDWQFTIVGEGDDQAMLESLIQEKALQNYVSIEPYCKDVVSLYHSASIYAMTSRFEGLPMVLIEAQSCALPCISFACPEGPADIIEDSVSGFLVEPNNVEEFARKLLRLIEDTELRKKMGEKAYKASMRFSTETIAMAWKKLLKL